MSEECPFSHDFDEVFAARITHMPRSFLTEILDVALRPGMISFAGGLPNKDLFPVEELRVACRRVLDENAAAALQYSNSDGYMPLREEIAKRYARRGVKGVDPANILITCGSQQALDLLAKALVNEGDRVLLEEPSYLGAIQALAVFKPHFVTVPLTERGLDTTSLAAALQERVKLMYVIPNFQNPSGISYDDENRQKVADIVRKTRTFLVEDDPYGELRFEGTPKTSFMNLIPEHAVLLGTFSKTVVPGFRLGWMVVPPGLRDRLLVAKQAADLNTSAFTQYVMHRYMADNDVDAHIAQIKAKYKKQKDEMVGLIHKYFPSSVTHTNPEGGMFLWVTLPGGASAMEFFDKAAAQHVCVVPGYPFYVGRDKVSTLRLSFSTVDPATFEEGIKRMGDVVRAMGE